MRVALGAGRMGHPAPFPIPPRYGHIDCATRDVSTYVTKAGTLGSQAFRYFKTTCEVASRWRRVTRVSRASRPPYRERRVADTDCSTASRHLD